MKNLYRICFFLLLCCTSVGAWAARSLDDGTDSEAKTALSTAITSYTDAKSTTTSDDAVGYYNTTAFDAAITAAQAALNDENATDDSYTTALSTLNAAITASINMPQAGKYYQIISANPGFATNQNGKTAAIYNDPSANRLKWKTGEETDRASDLTFFFTFSAHSTGSDWNLQTYPYETYVDTNGSNSTSAPSSPIKLGWICPGQFYILYTAGYAFHAEGHAGTSGTGTSGIGTGGNVIGYQTSGTANGSSAWIIKEVALPTEGTCIVTASPRTLAGSYLAADFSTTATYKTATKECTASTTDVTSITGYEFDSMERVESTFAFKAKYHLASSTTMPFKTDGTKYGMTLRSKRARFIAASEGATATGTLLGGADFVLPLQDAYFWTFTGDEANGYQIKSAAMSEGQMLAVPASGTNTTSAIGATTTDSRWDLVYNGTNWRFCAVGTTNNFMNDNANAGIIGSWSNNSGFSDAGSDVTFSIEAYTLPEEAFRLLNVLHTDYEMQAASDGMWGSDASNKYDADRYFTLEVNEAGTAYYIKSESGLYVAAKKDSQQSAQWGVTDSKTGAGTFYAHTLNGEQWGFTYLGDNITANTSSLHLGSSNSYMVVGWNSTTSSQASLWKVSTVSDDYDALVKETNEQKGKLGYPTTESANTLLAKAATQAATNKCTAVKTLFDAADLEYVLPSDHHFYRVQGGYTGAYITGTSSSTSGGAGSAKMSTDEDASTIFLLQKGTETNQFLFLSYDSGYYLYQTSQIGTVGSSNYYKVAHSAGNTPYFTLYNVYNTGESGSCWVYDHYDNTNGPVINKNSDPAATRTDWKLIEVTSLPVRVHTIPYATLYTPVALNIANATGLEAYTGVKGEGEITLTKVEGVIPAGSAVLLYLPDGFEEGTTEKSFDLPILYDDATAAPTTNDFTGEYYTHAAPANAFTLGRMYSGDEVTSDEAGFRRYTGTNINGFRAYVIGEAEETGGEAESTRAYTLVFDSAEVTAIQEALDAAHRADAAAYDLQGRRVMQPRKGLYVVGGKKVIVK